MKEKDIEKKCRLFAEERGVLVRKLSTAGRRGPFDRVYILPAGQTLWVEHKQPGGSERPAQVREYEKLQLRGHHAVFCWTFEEFKKVFGRALARADIRDRLMKRAVEAAKDAADA